MLTDIQRRSIEQLHAMVTDAFNRTQNAERESHAIVGEPGPALPAMLVDAMNSLNFVQQTLKSMLDIDAAADGSGSDEIADVLS